MTTEKSTVQLGVLYSVRQELIRRITGRLLEIAGDVNPGDRRGQNTQDGVGSQK
jgi:hypothetical protein